MEVTPQHCVCCSTGSHGKVYFEQGDFEAALEAFQEAYKVATALPSIPDPSLAQLLNNLTLCSQKLGKWTQATSYCARCLEHRANYQEPGHIEFIRCQNYLANCYYHSKKSVPQESRPCVCSKVFPRVLIRQCVRCAPGTQMPKRSTTKCCSPTQQT